MQKSRCGIRNNVRIMNQNKAEYRETVSVVKERKFVHNLYFSLFSDFCGM